MYEWRKEQNWTEKQCLHCKLDFKVRKKDEPKRMFCSPECHKSSDYKKQKLREWNHRPENPFKSPERQEEFRKTKLEKYGTLSVHKEQGLKTCLERYGTRLPLLRNPSNGKRISKIQKRYYSFMKEKHPDALLEHHLQDVDIFVDIYIPSSNTVIEVYGDY